MYSQCVSQISSFLNGLPYFFKRSLRSRNFERSHVLPEVVSSSSVVSSQFHHSTNSSALDLPPLRASFVFRDEQSTYEQVECLPGSSTSTYPTCSFAHFSRGHPMPNVTQMSRGPPSTTYSNPRSNTNDNVITSESDIRALEDEVEPIKDVLVYLFLELEERPPEFSAMTSRLSRVQKLFKDIEDIADAFELYHIMLSQRNDILEKERFEKMQPKLEPSAPTIHPSTPLSTETSTPSRRGFMFCQGNVTSPDHVSSSSRDFPYSETNVSENFEGKFAMATIPTAPPYELSLYEDTHFMSSHNTPILSSSSMLSLSSWSSDSLPDTPISPDGKHKLRITEPHTVSRTLPSIAGFNCFQTFPKNRPLPPINPSKKSFH